MTSFQEPSGQDITIPAWVNQHSRPTEPVPIDTPSRLARAFEYARDHKGEVALYSALGTAATVAAIALLNSGGGSSSPEDTYGVNEAKIDTSIASVTLDEDANIRFDPYVSGKSQEPNLVESLGAPLVVDANHDLKVINGTDDGQWIGIPVETLKASYPGFDDHGDNDGTVWVNEQGIDSITHVDQDNQ